MDEILSIPGARRLCSCLLQALALAFLGFQSFSAAHVGIHEEIETLSRIIQQDPTISQLYESRGEANRLHGNLDRAAQDFKTALDIDPGNVAATIGLGQTYLDQGNARQAMIYLNRALAKESDNIRALTTRAQAYTRLHRPLDAAADYTSIIKQFGAHKKPIPDHYLECARAYALAGDTHIERALNILDEGINVLGRIRILELYAAELEVKRGNFDTGLARLDSILADATRKEFLLLKRGDILTAAGQPAAATREYRAAQDAIATLPPQRRNTSAIRQLQANLVIRLASHGVSSDTD